MSKTQGKVIIYQKPTCSTCRKTVKLVTASRAEFATIDYYKEPFTKALLKRLLKKAGRSAKEILRTKEDIYKRLQLAKKKLTDDQLLDLLVKHPDLIQRPLVERGDRVVLARPAETVKKLLT